MNGRSLEAKCLPVRLSAAIEKSMQRVEVSAEVYWHYSHPTTKPRADSPGSPAKGAD